MRPANSPAISVVLPVYNAAAHLREAVESVLAQTCQEFELLAINDGSTDNTLRILREFEGDRRVRVLNQPNSGLVATLNRGIREARGFYIARMDADDICTPGRFQMQIDYLEARPRLALLGGSVATLDEDGRMLAPVVRFPQNHEEIWSALGRRPWVMCHPAVMFRREAAIDAGLYDPAFAHAEDTEFFARMMTRHQAANMPNVLLHYRIRRGAISVMRKDHGRINAELVARMIDAWRPGERFRATSETRKAADAAIEASSGKSTQADVEATYQCRIARELLRGRQWRAAAGHFIRALKHDQLRLMPYAGIACAALRIGGTREAAA